MEEVKVKGKGSREYAADQAMHFLLHENYSAFLFLPLLCWNFPMVVNSRNLSFMEKVIHSTTGIQRVTEYHHPISLC